MKPGKQVPQSVGALTTDVLLELAARRDQFLTFLRPRTRSPDDAEDLLQLAFIRATRKISSLREVNHASAWFYRILRRMLADYAWDLARQKRLVEQSKVEALDEEEVRATCSCSVKLVETLLPQYAEVLRRVDLAEESVGEVALALSITQGNVLVRLHRGRKALRELLLISCGTTSSRACLDCNC